MDPRVLDNALFPQMVIESPGRRRAWRESLQDGARAFSRRDWSRGTGKNDIPRKRMRGMEPWPSSGLLLGRRFSLQGYLNKPPGALSSNTVGPGRSISPVF